jgi:hypothetical protein
VKPLDIGDSPRGGTLRRAKADHFPFTFSPNSTKRRIQIQGDGQAAKISHSSKIRPKDGTLLTTVAGPSFKGKSGDRLSQGGHDDIHQPHSNQHPHTRIEPVKGNYLASVDGHHTETHDYG